MDFNEMLVFDAQGYHLLQLIRGSLEPNLGQVTAPTPLVASAGAENQVIRSPGCLAKVWSVPILQCTTASRDEQGENRNRYAGSGVFPE